MTTNTQNGCGELEAPTADWVLRIPRGDSQGPDPERYLTREWLVANGLGGYASGTVAGATTRRYHGLLVAALPAPLGRQLMFNHLSERLRLPDRTPVRLGGQERVGSLRLHGAPYLTEFWLEMGMPVWRFEVNQFIIEKRILLPYRQNTVHVNYRLVEGRGRIQLRLRPSVHFRPHEAPVTHLQPGAYTLTVVDQRYELFHPSDLPPLRLYLYGKRSAFTTDGRQVPDILYRVEKSRGYEAQGTLWSPGYFQCQLSEEEEATLVASTEPWENILALKPEGAWQAEVLRRERLIACAPRDVQSGPARELVLAADQFIVSPAGRVEDAARAHAAGDEVRTIIAGYHWFTDWGRDTMISLEGLALCTGREAEAGWILRTFALHIRDGLIPNLFPEGEKEGLYHTADASLWFFHAIDRYLQVTEDRGTLELLLPKLQEMIEHHLRGTRFGIGVDPADGLLRQGAEGYQLTWMDAKVADWVVTPRRGKAVEINALWYNALRLMERWAGELIGDDAARPYAEHAERARESFQKRFWYDDGGYLYDVVDGEQGDDSACRPNQIFAISLPHAILDRSRWQPVFDTVRKRLLTPVGMRSLAPGHVDYKAKYYGDLRSRDAAYHQGTVWGWLIGPYVDAWLKLNPGQRQAARGLLEGFVEHLGEACIGSISEIFDAEEPFTPRGCIAQAWSVAEVLRLWAKTAE